jgi:hypothetical protein
MYFIMLKFKQKNARNTFGGWAERMSFPLTTVFEAWTELVKRSTCGHQNESEHGSTGLLGIYVYDFALAVLCDPKVKIFREETKLWAMWYGKNQYVHVSGSRNHLLMYIASLLLDLK